MRSSVCLSPNHAHTWIVTPRTSGFLFHSQMNSDEVIPHLAHTISSCILSLVGYAFDPPAPFSRTNNQIERVNTHSLVAFGHFSDLLRHPRNLFHIGSQ